MKILDEDLFKINNLYNQFIKIMVEDFNDNNDVSIKNALSFVNQIYKDLVVNNKKENYPNIDYISNLGIYSLYGFQVCRTTNKMLYDFMKELGFDVNMKTVLIDENNDWHIVEPIFANHVVVNIKDKKSDKFFDLNSDIYFENIDGAISIINIDEQTLKIDYSQYKKIINEINKILDKYLLLEKLGIERVYTYK